MEVPQDEAAQVASAMTGLPASLIEAAMGDARGALVMLQESARDAPALPTPRNAADAPAVTVTLKRFGRDTRALERNVARAPIFGPRGPVQLAMEWDDVAPVYGRRFSVFAPRGPLTVRDELFLTELMTEYVHAGCPDRRRIPFSLTGAADRACPTGPW